jgi:hypothetical protein
VQNKKGDWRPIDPNEKYKIVVNDYSFKSGEGYDFAGAENIEYVPERISVAFRHYLDKHHVISPQAPDRIVPLTKNLAQIQRKRDGLYLSIKDAPPNSKLTIVEGTHRSVASIKGFPVPLANPKIFETGIKATADGTQLIKLKGIAEKSWVCVYAQPTVTSKKVLISYPLELENSTK